MRMMIPPAQPLGLGTVTDCSSLTSRSTLLDVVRLTVPLAPLSEVHDDPLGYRVDGEPVARVAGARARVGVAACRARGDLGAVRVRGAGAAAHTSVLPSPISHRIAETFAVAVIVCPPRVASRRGPR
jgi:hypothetical protein